MAGRRSRRPPRASLVRRWLGLSAIVIVAYLYYHPLRTYFETRSQLGSRRAEVAQLAAQERELQRRLEASTSADSLAREARALGALHNKHVVRVHDAGTLPTGLRYLVMEFLVGVDLRRILGKEGSLPTPSGS